MKLYDNQIEPMWIRIPEAVILTGISRSGLYELFDTSNGPIKTSNIVMRGRTRGIRLICKQSLLNFIESCSHAA